MLTGGGASDPDGQGDLDSLEKVIGNKEGRVCQPTGNEIESRPFTRWGLGTGSQALMWNLESDP